MLYNIKDNRLKYWREYDELGDRDDFQFESSACACGSDEKRLVANTTRHRQEFSIVQCLNCGTLRIDPYLTKEAIDLYYSETYGKIKRMDAPAEKLWKKQAKASKLLFSLIKPFINHQSSILDFGGATGGKMQELLAQGYDVYLKELDRKYFEYGVSRGLKPYPSGLSAGDPTSQHAHPALDAGPIEETPERVRGVQGGEGRKFDFIVLARVLEHMSEPVEFLHHLKSMLAEDGYIYVEVPLIENARDGYLLNEFHIAHKFYFTGLSLKNICAMAGLSPVWESRNLLIVKLYAEAQRQSSKKMMKASNRVLFKALLMKHFMRLGLKEGRGKN